MLIPCDEATLKVYDWHVRNKVPKERRDQEAAIVAAGGTVFDLWLQEAERLVLRDLRKFKVPIDVADLEQPSQLTPLKAFKTLELLCRANIKEGAPAHQSNQSSVGDNFQQRATYFADQYQNELVAIPLLVAAGTEVQLSTGLVRG